MFSSTTNPNLFPNLSASNYHYHLFSPPPFLGSDATDFFLHHSDLLMADTLFGMVQVSNKSPVIRNQEASTEPINEQKFGTNIGTKLTKAKKQKHSKIFTAQGLRDRRVRLSIETARKFFDLQDMLGFEKASKTIDWLLKNSKTEIKDLMNNRVMKAESPSTLLSTSTTAPAGCEVVSRNHEAGTKMMMMMMKKLIKDKKVKSMKDRVVLYDRYLASREARARARERARERTREKKMLRSDQLKGSPISSDEQKISEYSFKFVQTLEGACHI